MARSFVWQNGDPQTGSNRSHLEKTPHGDPCVIQREARGGFQLFSSRLGTTSTQRSTPALGQEKKITMDVLPDEIALQIITCLPLASVGNVACVSWRFNRLSMDESVWQHLYNVMYPLCTNATCMTLKGRGLDHTPWSNTGEDATKGSAPKEDGPLYPSHPLRPFLHTSAKGRDSPLRVFAEAPFFACPHHCPSVIKARSYRWACASQCTPPRPIDATGVRVGRGPRPSPHPTASESVGIYRGEWHAQVDLPDGLGMLTIRHSHPHYESDVRTVGLWCRGDHIGYARQWEVRGDRSFSHPNYQEGIFSAREIVCMGLIAEGKTNRVYLDHKGRAF